MFDILIILNKLFTFNFYLSANDIIIIYLKESISDDLGFIFVTKFITLILFLSCLCDL